MAISESLKSGKLIWKNIVDPDVGTIDILKKEYDFHELDLEDTLSKTESPKLEEQKDYVFIVFHFPIRDSKTDVISISALSVFIGANYIITLSNGRLKKLDDFFHNLSEDRKERESVFKKGSGYVLYLMMDELFEVYNKYINQLQRDIREIEENIFEGNIMKDRLYEIMSVKRQIIHLKRAVTPHAPIILALEKLHKRFINKTLELYFDNVADKISRAKNSLEALDETIGTLEDANESLTSHNTNRVIKILTIFSVTLLPLTLLSGIYGMNIQLPFSEHPFAFLIVLGSMVVTVILLLIFFKIKKFI